jgi:hypothetical protein
MPYHDELLPAVVMTAGIFYELAPVVFLKQIA